MLKISKGNSKMGAISSISLPATVTCRPNAPCKSKCYAAKLERLRPSVKAAYNSNWKLYQTDRDTYWREAEAAVMMSRYFRFHVSGDIPDIGYLYKMTEIAWRNPHCQILCFTKKYELVNQFCNETVLGFPDNLHIILSAWRSFIPENPNHIPEAHVRFKDGETTARKDAIECPGNCTECALIGEGCWVLKPGQQVVFNEH